MKTTLLVVKAAAGFLLAAVAFVAACALLAWALSALGISLPE